MYRAFEVTGIEATESHSRVDWNRALDSICGRGRILDLLGIE